MPFGEVRLTPGVNTEKTPTLNSTGIISSNLIRWKEGLVEKIGGWVRFYPNAIGGITGSIPRDLHPWQDINTVDYLGVAATKSLSVIANGVETVITPQTTTTDSAPDFSTTSGSSIVTIVDPNITNPTTNNSVFIQVPVSVGGLVLYGLYAIVAAIGAHSYQIDAGTDASATVSNGGSVPTFETTSGAASVTVNEIGHGKSVGGYAYVLVATAVGGVTIYGVYLVQSVVDADNFTISAAQSATSSATVAENGGNVRFTYYVALGPQAASVPYGSGLYGAGAYGIGAPISGTPGTPITALDWTQINWGEILLACPQGGGIYQWEPNTGFKNARIISTAPSINQGIFVAMPYQIVVAYGSSFTGAPNPLSLRWCTIGDFNIWNAATTNTAGSFQLSSGSMIVGGLSAPQQQLVWTDIDLWTMQYVGYPLVFGVSKIMSGCGLVGSHAAGVLGSRVYWMSQKGFFEMALGGAPTPMPCTVWDYIFQNLDTTNAYKIRCAPNSQFNTIAWHFPSLASLNGENDSYVEFNQVEGEWTYGQYPTTGRSAWTDQSVLGSPIGGTPSSLVFQHEVGYDGDGAAINPIFTTGWFALGTAEIFVVLDQLIPDFKYGLQGGAQTTTPLITVEVADYQNGTVTTAGPYTVSQATTYLAIKRLRGRLARLTIQSLDAGSFWRIGLIRYRFAPAGRR